MPWIAAVFSVLLSVGLTPRVVASPADPDPLPPLPPRNPPLPVPEDWAGWQSVPKLLGVSQVRTEWVYSHAWDGGTIRSSTDRHATVFMELAIDNSPVTSTSLIWNVTDANGNGGESFNNSRSGSTGSSQLSGQGTYTGPLSLRVDPTFSFNLRDGTFTFSTLYEPAGSWSIQSQGRIIDRFLGTTETSDSYSGGSLDSTFFRDTVPKAVMPFSARNDSVSSIRDGAQGPGLSTTHRTASVQFWPDWNDVRLIVEIENVNGPTNSFEAWRPQGNLDSPFLPGPAPLRIHATLKPKDENPTIEQIVALPGVRRFRFELLDSSREPGVCMNWPPYIGLFSSPTPTEDPEYDLRFVASIPEAMVLSPRRQKAGVRALPLPDPTFPAAWVQLDCFDFGAHARLQVIAELSDGREVLGYRESGDQKVYLINVPHRDDNDFVAKSWRDEKKTTDPDEADDDDQPVGDGQKGDGFSTYEEYRGFRVAGKHASPDPAVKDLFVRSMLEGAESSGCRLVERHSADGNLKGLKIWEKLNASEMSPTRIMNPYRSAQSPRSTSEFQYGLILQLSQGNGPIALSITKYLDGSTVHRPRTVEYIAIDPKDEELDTAVAHELLHAISVVHHGNTDLGLVRWFLAESSQPDGSVRTEIQELRIGQHPATGLVTNIGTAHPIRLFFEGHSTPITPTATNLPLALPTELWVAVRGGEHSGADLCVTRYNVASAYIPGLTSSSDRVFIDASRGRIVPPEVDANGRSRLRRICKSCAGNGLNPERHGHARVGDCLHLLCVRDSAPNRPAPIGGCPDTAQPAVGGAR